MSDIENASGTALDDKDVGISGKPPMTSGSTTKSSKAAAKSDKQSKTISGKKQAFMYLGPNVPGGILLTGSVYRELPEHLSGVFAKAPEIKELFVEIKEIPAFKAELERQGSEPFRMKQSVERLISEGALHHGGV